MPQRPGLRTARAISIFHDLDMLAGYCAGWSLRTLLHEGLNGVPGKVEAGPPKHMSSAVGQIVNFLGTLQNEMGRGAGVQLPFVPTWHPSCAGRTQLCAGQAVHPGVDHNLNMPSRWGTQTPFTNLTFDWVCPQDSRPGAGGRWRGDALRLW